MKKDHFKEMSLRKIKQFFKCIKLGQVLTYTKKGCKVPACFGLVRNWLRKKS